MFFLNFSLPEFLAIAGALGGLITVLYFFDRSKRKKTVSTLRFWASAVGAEQQKRRKSVRQPWSLLLQLLSILLLLLAMARLQWGSRDAEIRNTVLLLDTSSAASWRAGSGSVLDVEKALARRYLSRVNSRDRVMLVRADALATPTTPFTTDREQLRAGINASAPGYSALNIGRALTFALQAENRAAGSPGEIVYIGPKRVPDVYLGSAPDLRILEARAGRENCGIRGIIVTRSEGEDAWRAAVTLQNEGTQNRLLTLSARFASTSFAPRRVLLRAGEQAVVSYQFVANSAGRLTARLDPRDDLPLDDEASVMVPISRAAKVIVYSSRAEAWRPLLGADKSLDVQYESAQQYKPRPDADVMILDGFAPRNYPQVPSLWVNVPSQGSPLPIQSEVANQVVTQWNSDIELGAGLHARDLLLPRAEVFQIFDKDFVVAATSKGPVAVVRPASESGERLAVVGFDFMAEPLRYKITSPILFANLMRWLAPQSFRAIQLSAEPVGLASIALENGEEQDEVHVTEAAGHAVPVLVVDRKLQFFVETPTVIHIVTRDRERFLSMVLPQIAAQDWKVPAVIPQSMPSFSGGGSAAMDLWQILACLGGLGLIIEWFLFARQKSIRLRPRSSSTLSANLPRPAREREMVGK